MIQNFKQLGYIVKKGIFDLSQLDSLLSQIDQVFIISMEHHKVQYSFDNHGRLTTNSMIEFFNSFPQAYIGCMKVMQNIFDITRYCNNEIIHVVKRLGVKTPCYAVRPIIMINNPSTSQQEENWRMPPHQDWRDVQGSLNAVMVWIALKDVTSDIGSLQIIPGSHLWGLLPTQEDEWFRRIKDDRVKDDQFVSIPLERGDAIFFSGFLVHRSGVNSGKKSRYSLQYRFNDLSEKQFIERHYPSTYAPGKSMYDFVDENNLISGEAVAAALNI